MVYYKKVKNNNNNNRMTVMRRYWNIKSILNKISNRVSKTFCGW